MRYEAYNRGTGENVKFTANTVLTAKKIASSQWKWGIVELFQMERIDNTNDPDYVSGRWSKDLEKRQSWYCHFENDFGDY
jgi:hypothetical protein